MELEYGAATIKGKNHFTNEDSFRLLGNSITLVEESGRGQIFAVFDGVGSAPKGGQAAQEMSSALLSFFQDDTIPASPAGLLQLLDNTNHTIKKWGHMEGSQRELGACCGTVFWLSNGALFIFHAGDTFGMHLKFNTDLPTDYQILTTEHAIGNGITRYFGMGENLEIDTAQYPVEEGDILVIFSDGVLKTPFGFNYIAENVRQWTQHSPEFAAKELCRIAKLKGSPDDITAVVIEIISLQ